MREFHANKKAATLRLPVHLSPSDRQCLHELATLLGLDHKTEGETLDQKRLVISKRHGE